MAVILPAVEKDLQDDGVSAPPAPAPPIPPPKSHQHKLVLQMVAGAFSGAVTKTATAPLERIKIIFQIQGMAEKDLKAPKYTSILQTLALVSKEEGPLALWKGNGANVLRVIPVYGLKFAFNDTFKTLVAGPEKKRLETGELLAVGTLAGGAGAGPGRGQPRAPTRPLPCAAQGSSRRSSRTRSRLCGRACPSVLSRRVARWLFSTAGAAMRRRASPSPHHRQGVQYKGIADCFRQMVRTEGVRGL